MSFMVAPPSHRNDSSPEEGEIDRLLHTFYRAEMPDPWPSCEALVETPTVLPFPAPLGRRPLFTRSRLALAASVALLMGGLGLLSSKFGTTPTESSFKSIADPSATRLLPGSTLPPGDVQFKGPFIDGGELKVEIDEFPTGPGR